MPVLIYRTKLLKKKQFTMPQLKFLRKITATTPLKEISKVNRKKKTKRSTLHRRKKLLDAVHGNH
jgi:hypothetical protein